jgi:hypothetical protein
MIEEVEEKAQQILAQLPGAVVAFRLLRGMLQQRPINLHHDFLADIH